jgi:hypothetical protein
MKLSQIRGRKITASITCKLCGNLRKHFYAWFPFGKFRFISVYGMWKPRPLSIPYGLRSGNLRKPQVYNGLWCTPRLRDRKHTTPWIKIISHHKPWKILCVFIILDNICLELQVDKFQRNFNHNLKSYGQYMMEVQIIYFIYIKKNILY